MKRLTYIESTGTQYIDTGVVATQDIGFELDFLTSSPLTSSDARHILSAVNTSTNRINLALYTAYSGGEFYFGPNKADPGIIVGERITIRFKDNVLTTLGGTTTIAAATFDSELNLLLCARNNAGTADRLSSNRIYGLKLWSGDSLIRDYIPVLDDEGTACLYDQVNSTYYYNAGTGSFTAGPEVFEGRQGRRAKGSGGGGSRSVTLKVTGSGNASYLYLLLPDGSKVSGATTKTLQSGQAVTLQSALPSSGGRTYVSKNGAILVWDTRIFEEIIEISGDTTIKLTYSSSSSARVEITEG